MRAFNYTGDLFVSVFNTEYKQDKDSLQELLTRAAPSEVDGDSELIEIVSIHTAACATTSLGGNVFRHYVTVIYRVKS